MYCFVIGLLLCLSHTIYGMEEPSTSSTVIGTLFPEYAPSGKRNIDLMSQNYFELKHKSITIYSHGFGESAEWNDAKLYNINSRDNIPSVPEYPDAPKKIDQAVFYTKPAVLTLAQGLKKCKKEFEIIHLVGKSCGAGTAVNCLTQLINYNDVYWQDTGITHKDAFDIIAAINRGSIFLTVPFLHLEKARTISVPSTILGTVSLMGTCALAYYIAKRTNNPYITKLNATGTFLATNYMFGKYFKRAWSSVIHHIGVPVISNMHYDSFHPSPLESIAHLKGKFTCPILLDIRANDGVLDNPDEDIVYVYDTIKNDKTHIYISEDGSHNNPPLSSMQVFMAFKEKYILPQTNCTIEYGNRLVGADHNLFAQTQPTVDQLREKIKPLSFFRRCVNWCSNFLWKVY